MSKANFNLLTGRGNNHVSAVEISDDLNHFLHPEALEAFLQLKNLGARNGLHLKIASSFRDFNRQCVIWNNKALGKRALLDSSGNVLDFNSLSPDEIVSSILRWSALPGASRHHWGTEIDVYEQNALPCPDYQVLLTPDEVRDDGIFGEFHLWLSELILADKAFGFYRPYEDDLGGVAPERWHLSYAPLSTKFQAQYDFDLFCRHLDLMKKEKSIMLFEIIEERKEEIYKNFIQNTNEFITKRSERS